MKVTDEQILAVLPKRSKCVFIAEGFTTVHTARLINLTESATRKRLEALQLKRLVSGSVPPRTGRGKQPVYWVHMD